MTLKKHLLLVLASSMLLGAATAGAQIVPGPRDPGRPAPYPEPYPGDGRGGYTNERLTLPLHRRVNNEILNLRQMLNIDSRYANHTIESVVVQVRERVQNTALEYIVDGSLEQTLMNPYGQVTIYPRSQRTLGHNMNSIRLGVRGLAYIDTIVVNLRGRGGYEQEVPLTLHVNRRLYGNDRLDLRSYVDLSRYQGYAIRAVEVVGRAEYNSAFLDLVINGFNEGQTMHFGRYSEMQFVTPRSAVIGRGAESIVLMSRGNMEVQTVTLRLVIRR